VCDLAAPNQILVSHVIYDLRIGKKITFTNEQEVKFKGFSVPMKTYSVK